MTLASISLLLTVSNPSPLVVCTPASPLCFTVMNAEPTEDCKKDSTKALRLPLPLPVPETSTLSGGADEAGGIKQPCNA